MPPRRFRRPHHHPHRRRRAAALAGPVLEARRRWGVWHGDCLELLRALPDCSVDAVVCDPPAAIGFMGREWDSDRGGRAEWVAWLREIMAEVRRVLKPGGHALVWALPRTSHWTGWALETAELEPRDLLAHYFANGFPKALDVAAAIDRRRKDDPRPLCRYLRRLIEERSSVAAVASHFGVSRRMVEHWAARDTDSQPTIPTLEQWAEIHRRLGVAPDPDLDELCRELNARKGRLGEAWEARRITGRHETPAPAEVWRENHGGAAAPPPRERRDEPATLEAALWAGWSTALKPAHEVWWLVRRPLPSVMTIAGAVLEHGTGALNVEGCRVPAAGEELRRSARGGDNGLLGSSTFRIRAREAEELPERSGRWPPNVLFSHALACTPDPEGGWRCAPGCPARRLEEQGGPVRVCPTFHPGDPDLLEALGDPGFRYAPKPSRREKDAGVTLPPRTGGQATHRQEGSAGLSNPRAGAGRTGGARNIHPTVKGIGLMRWLIRLITPPGGLVLDPFGGSGSTVAAALLEGHRVLAADLSGLHVRISRDRAAFWGGVDPLEVTAADGFSVAAPRPPPTDPRQAALF